MAAPAPTTVEQKTFEVLKGLSAGSDASTSLSLGNVFPKIEQFVYYLGLAVSIIFIILAAYQYFNGENDSSKKNVEDAQKSLTYAFVALVVLLLLRVIFIIIANILGFTFNPGNITK